MTKEEIYKEWLTKDGMGVRYTSEDRIVLAMNEYSKQQLETALKEILKGQLDVFDTHKLKNVEAISKSHILRVFKELSIEEETIKF